MEQFQITERQLCEDLSLGMVQRISTYNEIKNYAEKREQSKQSHGY